MASGENKFDLFYSDGSAVLVVFPGAQIYPDDILNRMRILRIPRVASSRIQTIIDSATGEPEFLVEWPAGAELSSTFLLEIDENGRSVEIRLAPPRKGGGIPGENELHDALAGYGVVHGIDGEAISELLSNPRYDEAVCVAKATDPVHGRAATPFFTFETIVGRPYIIDGSGRVDLRELRFIQEKQRGDILVRITRVVQPSDGKDVFGKAIPAEPAPPTELVRPGKNTEISADESEIIASEDGNVFFHSGVVQIEPIVVVDRVGYETGNIEYKGSIQIKRGIADGFTVRAGGILEVGECIGRVTVSSGREMLLKGGINGGGEGVVVGNADVYAKYVEGAKIDCKGNLFVTDAIMHSTVVVHANLGLRGKHAEIIGGIALVGGNLWCKKVGSISETPSRVTVGIDPALLVEYGSLNEESETLRDRIDDLDRIERHMNAKLESAEAGIDPSMLSKVRLERDNNELELQRIESRMGELRSQMKPSTKVRAIVEERIYPRATICFGRDEFRAPSRGSDRTILRYLEGKIIEEGFNPSEPPDWTSLIGGPDT